MANFKQLPKNRPSTRYGSPNSVDLKKLMEERRKSHRPEMSRDGLYLEGLKVEVQNDVSEIIRRNSQRLHAKQASKKAVPAKKNRKNRRKWNIRKNNNPNRLSKKERNGLVEKPELFGQKTRYKQKRGRDVKKKWRNAEERHELREEYARHDAAMRCDKELRETDPRAGVTSFKEEYLMRQASLRDNEFVTFDLDRKLSIEDDTVFMKMHRENMNERWKQARKKEQENVKNKFFRCFP